MSAAYRTQLLLARIGRLMWPFVPALRAGTKISALSVRLSHINVHGLTVLDPVAPAKRAFRNLVTLVRLVEITSTAVAYIPVAVEIDLTTFDDDLLTSDQRLGNLGPGLGINTGQCWP